MDIQPRFLPGDEVFGIPADSGWCGLAWFGTYRISKVAIVNNYASDQSKGQRFVYYTIVAGAMYFEVELEYVFANKQEFIKFITKHEFSYRSPVQKTV